MLSRAKALKPNILQIIQLFKVISKAEDEFDLKYGKEEGEPVHLGSRESIERRLAYFKDENLIQTKTNLFDYVNNNLTDDDMDIIMAVMYIGRDKKRFINTYEIELDDEFDESSNYEEEQYDPNDLLVEV